MRGAAFLGLALGVAAAAAGCNLGDPAAPWGHRGANGGGDDGGAGAGGGASCDPSAANAGPRVLRRLTDFEYDNTLRDLLGIAPQYGSQLPPDDVVNGFDDNAAALHVSQTYTDHARSAAEAIGGSVALAGLVPCAVASGDDACAASFVASFGLRAFRRPPTGGETQRYVALYQAVKATDGFEGGVRAVITAMLQSPGFLYREELGTSDGHGGYTLTPYEIASELSYMLTGSMPDAPLFADAASGKLSDRAVIASHAARLVASDAHRALLEHFVRQWLELDHLQFSVKDAATFPAYTPALRDAMYDETVATFTRAMRDPNATFPQLLTSGTTWASPALAAYYGLGSPTGAADPSGLAPYQLPAGRVGLLTQASLLTEMAKTDRSSPVLRGKLVRERFFCQALPPPPPGVNTQLPPPSPGASNRQVFEAHDTNPACAGCHTLMDPIGFGFEGFDGIGQPVPPPVDTTGQVIGTASTDGKFDGVPDLAAKLAKSPDVQACFALEWYRYAYGVAETQDSSCGAPAFVQGFVSGGLGLQQLLVALTQTDHFVRRVADAAPADAGAPPPPTDDAGGASPVADAAPPALDGAGPPTGNVQVSVQTQSSWQTGYCDNVTVTNGGTSSVAWTATLPAKGTINNVWNATQTTSGGSWVFMGASFNATLAAGASTSFGFCAND